ncbi:NUDIX hydrolase [Flectobacillus rivi]|uniref:NUDIX hydrolase n=1 Tax=Flectobacillus rivi TaxID=2984209 RepID=A0ABT6Z506_9BACT|nr:NUDIX hydrolase [Flectobacillus rivi]MDI9875977.1 NUDIX hydrolase [Flectobacillus rivi]
MHRKQLLQLLEQYTPADATEQLHYEAICEFVNQQPDCFERTLLIGHVTGSAWIVDAERQHTLLTHHHKLNQWFQTGGHCDGDPDVLAVSLREAEEETGLTSVKAISPQIFDIDVHIIPARKTEPEHYHYDVRFLIEADKNEPLIVSSESKDLAWVAISEVSNLNNSESIMRMARKSLAI